MFWTSKPNVIHLHIELVAEVSAAYRDLKSWQINPKLSAWPDILVSRKICWLFALGELTTGCGPVPLHPILEDNML